MALIMWTNSIYTLVLLLILTSFLAFCLVKKEKLYWAILIVFLLVYFVLLANVYIYEYILQLNINYCDTNHDEIISGLEESTNCLYYMDRLINDSGRRLTPFIGFIFSILYVLFLLSIRKIYLILNGKKLP